MHKSIYEFRLGPNFWYAYTFDEALLRLKTGWVTKDKGETKTSRVSSGGLILREV